MSVPDSDILSEAARHAGRLVGELESRRVDLEKASAPIVEQQLHSGLTNLSDALAAARRTLAAVERELSGQDHSSDSTSTQ